MRWKWIWILLGIVLFVLILSFFYREEEKERYKPPEEIDLFLIKIKTKSHGIMKKKKIEKYNEQICFVYLETMDAKEELLYSVFLGKRYAILERTRFLSDDSWFSKNEQDLRIIQFNEKDLNTLP